MNQLYRDESLETVLDWCWEAMSAEALFEMMGLRVDRLGAGQVLRIACGKMSPRAFIEVVERAGRMAKNAEGLSHRARRLVKEGSSAEKKARMLLESTNQLRETPLTEEELEEKCLRRDKPAPKAGDQRRKR